MTQTGYFNLKKPGFHNLTNKRFNLINNKISEALKVKL